MKRILLGVTGSIAAFKSADIASKLSARGFDVHVVMTANATKFISPMVFETLTRNKVYTELFSDDDTTHLTHISQTVEADLILVAPASFNIIGKAACGIADDLLSSILAAAPSSKVIYAPAMNEAMLANPAFTMNRRHLEEQGSKFIGPEEGLLACGVKGKGRLAGLDAILEGVEAFFCKKLLKGKKVVITAGATREYLDPIRFISNTSSGLMGISLAKACRDMGAIVTLILANSTYKAAGIDILKVDTVREMYEAALAHYSNCDLFFAAAAVSDYKPKVYSSSKIKKTDEELCLEFERNTDILLELGKQKTKQCLIGFAAESDNLLDNAKRKLSAKNLDMIIANDLSSFTSNEAEVTLITQESIVSLPKQSKGELAYAIAENVSELLLPSSKEEL